jgi:hypothetical protein
MADLVIWTGNVFGVVMLFVIFIGIFKNDNGDDRGA